MAVEQKCWQTLLQVEAKVINEPSLEGKTNLMIAAEHGKTEMVEYLLGQKADLMVQTVYGQTALHLASRYGHVGVVNLLLQVDRSQRLIHVGDKYQETPIFDAVQNRHDDVVKLLLLHDAYRQHKTIAGVDPPTRCRGLSAVQYLLAIVARAQRSLLAGLERLDSS